ncbi:hypothetical protein HRV97_01415 [Sphingomonas sp. HHU CXW]|uniref:Uncharacterized protein n=1 Tax=Sphingomonas hominis TaxID=2741495 RepID=A0ABX2JD49_9SPHN|nr:hypothetical protein [Sphingomonas hominis]NTS63818.1 hypothetical protein [Sphingomonas hominis]
MMFGFGRPNRLLRSPDEVIAAIAETDTAFPAIDALVSNDGRSGLAIDGAGRVLAMRLRGARVIARVVPWTALRQTVEGIVIDSGERRFGTVTLIGISALDVRRLGQPTAETLDVP